GGEAGAFAGGGEGELAGEAGFADVEELGGEGAAGDGAGFVVEGDAGGADRVEGERVEAGRFFAVGGAVAFDEGGHARIGGVGIKRWDEDGALQVFGGAGEELFVDAV